MPAKRSRWGEIDTLSEKQASNRGSAGMVEALDAPGGQLCTRCGAWRGELGLEPSHLLYIEHVVEVFREVRRVLRRDATLWLNVGDCYAGTPNGWSAQQYKGQGLDDRTFRDKPFSTTGHGLKPKDLALIPERVALALQDDGWWVRSRIIWHKTNPLPESILDRPTKSHEHLWLLTRSERYFYDAEAVREPAGGRGDTPNGWDTAPGSHGTMHRASVRGSKRQVGPTGKYDLDGRNSTDGRSKPHSGGREVYDNERVLHATRHHRDVWSIATQPCAEAHFATYPEKLVEPCILAGTSERGCCSVCAAPWERVKEPTPEYAACLGSNEGADADRFGEGYRKHSPAVAASYVTTGWRPTCDCHPGWAGEPVPCTVLDPFLGSGTTALVALRHGRHAVGIELQPEYLDIARKRLGVEVAA